MYHCACNLRIYDLLYRILLQKTFFLMFLQENDIINHLIEMKSIRRMRLRSMYGWTLRFNRPTIEALFGSIDEVTFKSNIMCCLVLWLFVVTVQTLVHYK